MAVMLSGVEEGEDGAMDSELESDDTWAVSASGVCFFSVPSRWPALIKSMGMCRNFLLDSNAVVRWFDIHLASSLRENLDAVAAAVRTVNTAKS
jgi:hypothetical protein